MQPARERRRPAERDAPSRSPRTGPVRSGLRSASPPHPGPPPRGPGRTRAERTDRAPAGFSGGRRGERKTFGRTREIRMTARGSPGRASRASGSSPERPKGLSRGAARTASEFSVVRNDSSAATALEIFIYVQSFSFSFSVWEPCSAVFGMLPAWHSGMMPGGPGNQVGRIKLWSAACKTSTPLAVLRLCSHNFRF